MRKSVINKALCIAATALLLTGFTGCGQGNSPETPVSQTSSTMETVELSAESEAASSNDPEEIPAEPIVHAFEGTAADKYPDADYIEQISAGRYIVLYRNKQTDATEVTVYDIAADAELNIFSVPNCDTLFLTPIIFEDKGFGFITEHRGKEPGVFGYYYDTEGNLVNKFAMNYDRDLNGSFALASDGSALYAALNDRVQCACGFDFNANFTTKILAVYGENTDPELITEFDAHTTLYLHGTTDDGRLVFTYSYNPEDIKVMSHEEYEMQWSLAEAESNRENGLAFLSADSNSSHELNKVYVLNKYYDHTFVNDDEFTLIDDNEIVRLYPDQNGVYQEASLETPVGLSGYYTDLYVSASGDYIVYPVYTDEFMDTTVNVVRFNDDQLEKIYESSHTGWKVELDPNYLLSFLDEETGDLYAVYNETAPDGLRRQLYHENVFNN